jgi:hypothetical protein
MPEFRVVCWINYVSRTTHNVVIAPASLLVQTEFIPKGPSACASRSTSASKPKALIDSVLGGWRWEQCHRKSSLFGGASGASSGPNLPTLLINS